MFYYRISRNSPKQGPVTKHELRELANQGKLTHESFIQKEGSESWVRTTRVKNLFDWYPSPKRSIVQNQNNNSVSSLPISEAEENRDTLPTSDLRNSVSKPASQPAPPTSRTNVWSCLGLIATFVALSFGGLLSIALKPLLKSALSRSEESVDHAIFANDDDVKLREQHIGDLTLSAPFQLKSRTDIQLPNAQRFEMSLRGFETFDGGDDDFYVAAIHYTLRDPKNWDHSESINGFMREGAHSIDGTILNHIEEGQGARRSGSYRMSTESLRYDVQVRYEYVASGDDVWIVTVMYSDRSNRSELASRVCESVYIQ